jgi:type IV secretion system protein VirB11
MRHGETALRYLLLPIRDYLDDKTVTEIVCQRPGEIGIERAGEWTWLDVPEFDFNTLDAIGLLGASLLAKTFDPYHPICLSELPDGQRLMMVRPPVTESGTISMTIRIPSQGEGRVWDDDFKALMRPVKSAAGVSSELDRRLLDFYHAGDWANFCSLAVRARKTIAVIGDTGSGKTTYLKRLMREIPLHERVITVEDKPEFGPMPHRNRVQMVFDGVTVTATEAVRTTLKMRPDRVLIQELTGAEAVAYARLLVAGHPGGLTTWHAGEDDPFTPLTVMAKLNNEGQHVDDDTLKAIYRRFVDIIVFCKCDKLKNEYSSKVIYFKAAQEGVAQ